MKYHVLLPEDEQVGGGLDYFQWASILRSVSALTAYHWVYRESAEAVARRRPADPERAHAALARRLLREHLAPSSTQLGDAYGRQGPAQRQARSTLARLANTRIDEVFQRRAARVPRRSSSPRTTASAAPSSTSICNELSPRQAPRRRIHADPDLPRDRLSTTPSRRAASIQILRLTPARP